MTESFTTGSLLSESWAITKKHLLFIIGLGLAALVILTIPFAISSFLFEQELFLVGGFLYLVGSILQLVVQIGFIHISIQLVNGEKAEFADLFRHWNRMGWFILASFAYAIITMIGLVLFIIPGIIWSVQFYYVPWLVAHKNMTLREAFTASTQMTSGVKWKITVFWAALVALVIVSMIPVFLGLIVTLPLIWVAYAVLYVRLLKRLEKPAVT